MGRPSPDLRSRLTFGKSPVRESRTPGPVRGGRGNPVPLPRQALKSGCKVQRSQIRTMDALLPLIGMCTVVAMRLVQMRDDARANPEQIVEESEETIQVLAAAIGKPDKTLRTKRGFLRGVAMLGGFFGRKCDLQPGWLTIARGWYELQTLLRGVEIGRALASRRLTT